MLILTDAHIRGLGADWRALTDCIEAAVGVMDSGNYAQPLKPYLRYGDSRNRIIAMPAYLGGPFETAGIKWIASFPGNRERGLPRAHGVIVLNRADTGEPYALLVGGLPNQLRTAAVSGLALRRYFEARSPRPARVAIIGWGPIGRAHFEMCASLFGDKIDGFELFDIGGIDAGSIPAPWRNRTRVAARWEEAYEACSVCITCTVATSRYIDRRPPDGSLLLNVSLRDYKTDALRSVKAVFVDDWDEVCRENTDIELLHRESGLTRHAARTLADLACREAFREIQPGEPILFCPMGMAVFDLAVAGHLADLAKLSGTGTEI